MEDSAAIDVGKELKALGWTSGPDGSHVFGPIAISGEEGQFAVSVLATAQSLGRLPSPAAVLRFAGRAAMHISKMPQGQDETSFLEDMRQIMFDVIEQEVALAQDAAMAIEAQIADLLDSAENIKAKAILFSQPDDV